MTAPTGGSLSGRPIPGFIAVFHRDNGSYQGVRQTGKGREGLLKRGSLVAVIVGPKVKSWLPVVTVLDG